MESTPSFVNIRSEVEQLEKLLMPQFDAFAKKFNAMNCNLVAAAYSTDHSPVFHALGVHCRPMGTDILDSTTVALVINVLAVNRLTFRAQILRQDISQRALATTSTYDKLTNATRKKFECEVVSLLPVLANTVIYGRSRRQPHGLFSKIATFLNRRTTDH